MALYRPPNKCPFCGEIIKEIHDKQEGVPWMMQRIGDNFLRYEDHVCPEGTEFPLNPDNMTEEARTKFTERLLSFLEQQS